MTARDIRQGFLDFFADRGHHVVASSPLVPGDDPTLLFTNAGMNQFKDLFLGKATRNYRRAASAQKCMRVSGKHNDLDNVGPSLRHHTFFEMLGNFSFGDYFKQDAVPFAWELLTGVWNLSPDRLYPTVFKGEGGVPRDDEAYALWTKLVPASRIAELGASENFWQMGDTGPCGRCSEIHYFRGDDVPCPAPVCQGIECDCERFVEVWNNVFMEFDRDAGGTLTPLPAPSIDTGMGLERIAAVIQDKISNYDTDLFTPILDAIGHRAGRPYSSNTTDLGHPDVSMRVVADHLRAMTFLIGDGVMPSNEWRGYVLRKIMRRAMRHGKKLGLDEPFLHGLVDVVVEHMGDAYPELRTGRDAIVQTVRSEEDRFDAVLTAGLPRLEDLLDRTEAAGSTVVSGDEVFRLYDSLGVPFDFAEDLASQRGLAIDRAAFDAAMDGQKDRARSAGRFKAGSTGFAFSATPGHGVEEVEQRLRGTSDPSQEFDRERASLDTEVLALFAGEDVLALRDQLTAGQSGYAVLDRTPFYLESGGQVSDAGIFSWPGGRAVVQNVVKAPAPVARRLHRVTVEEGTLRSGDTVTAAIDTTRRDATRRNHTATHLLHAALRQVMGTHVRQAGSLVAPDRLRFDFSHGSGLSADDRASIERIVNQQVFANTAVVTEERSTDEAIREGAMALFGEKYGDRVRVVSVPGFSVELCGGTHVRATGDIGPFVITEETGVAAGVRRIEAQTGDGAVSILQSHQSDLAGLVAALGVPASEGAEAIKRLQAEARRLSRENEQLKTKLALAGGAGPTAASDDVVTVGEARFVVRRVSGLEKGALRSLADSLRDRIAPGVVVVAADNDGKVQLLITVSRELTDRVKAGALVKSLAPIVGGGGGGRPDFAEAGGRDAAAIDEMLETARRLVTTALTPDA